MDFCTVHEPQNHSAFQNGVAIILNKKTEIELVKELKMKGLNLKDYDYSIEGNQKRLITYWRKRT